MCFLLAEPTTGYCQQLLFDFQQYKQPHYMYINRYTKISTQSILLSKVDSEIFYGTYNGLEIVTITNGSI